MDVEQLTRPFWVLRYAILLCRSPYEVTFAEAWRDGWASWETSQYWRDTDPMPSPAEALYEDQQHWEGE